MGTIWTHEEKNRKADETILATGIQNKLVPQPLFLSHEVVVVINLLNAVLNMHGVLMSFSTKQELSRLLRAS